MIKVYVNGQATETKVQNLAALLLERQFDMASIAVAMDGEFVAKAYYHTTLLQAGQKIEVLAPMQGG